MEQQKRFTEYVQKMDDKQWQEFRNTKWLEYKAEIQKHTLPPPDWYMQSKDSYIKFLDSKNETQKSEALMEIITPVASKSDDFQKIIKIIENPTLGMEKAWLVEDLTDEAWLEYRSDKWAKMAKSFREENIKPFGDLSWDTTHIPEQFMQSQQEFADGIKKQEEIKEQKFLINHAVGLLQLQAQIKTEELAFLDNEIKKTNDAMLGVAKAAEKKSKPQQMAGKK